MAKVDKDLCVGCGLCPQACADVFEMTDDGKAGIIAGSDPIPSGLKLPDPVHPARMQR